MIIGPYKPDGTTWGCDRDVCNGVFLNSSYVYVGSDNFPYVVGCWGPGPEHVHAPTCSNNGCGARSGSSTNTGTGESYANGLNAPEQPSDSLLSRSDGAQSITMATALSVAATLTTLFY